MRKAIIPLLIIVAMTTALFIYSFYRTGNQERPTGIEGPEAKALTEKINTSVAMDRWNEIDAIYFEFFPLGTRHFRDKKRGLVEVIFDEDNDVYRAQFELNGEKSKAWRNDRPLSGEDAEYAISTAREHHKREYFWLNPLEYIQRENVILKKVGERALLASFLQQDGSEGDAYMIVTDQTGRPTHMKIWASSLPLQGMEASLDEWKKLENGAYISLSRETFLQEIRFEQVEVYSKYPQSPAEDRFAKLIAGK